jgi:hypothetical protein
VKRDDPLVGGGILLLAFGFIAFVPPLLDREYLITSWLGSMEQPIGLSALIIGGILFGIGKLRQLRNSAPVVSPTDPSLLATPGSATPTPADPPASHGDRDGDGDRPGPLSA